MARTIVPPYIPKSATDYYGKALVAFNTSHTLAALFYLRTLLEQYMRLESKTTGKATGDELADAYAKTLDPDFARRFPSFKELYSTLSEALHAAREDEELFTSTLERIQEHFAAKPHFHGVKASRSRPASSA
jgi:hypothetical protein